MQRVALFVPKAGPTDGKSFYLENSALDIVPLGINFDEIPCIRKSVFRNVQVLSWSIIYTLNNEMRYWREVTNVLKSTYDNTSANDEDRIEWR